VWRSSGIFDGLERITNAAETRRLGFTSKVGDMIGTAPALLVGRQAEIVDLDGLSAFRGCAAQAPRSISPIEFLGSTHLIS
jgi:hypothetical protein